MSKTKVTVWLEDKLLGVIDDQAKAQGLSRSAVTSAHLECVLRQGAEASGAALALHLIRAACRLPREMATFAEAGVSGRAETGQHSASGQESGDRADAVRGQHLRLVQHTPQQQLHAVAAQQRQQVPLAGARLGPA